MKCCSSSSALRCARVLVVNPLDYEQHAAFHSDSSPQKATASKTVDKQGCRCLILRLFAMFFASFLGLLQSLHETSVVADAVDC